MQVRRLKLQINPDERRVITLSYNIEQPNVDRIARELMKLTAEERRDLYERTRAHFVDRHRDLEGILHKHFKELQPFLPAGLTLNETDRLLLATYFTKEYSIESAALFNPSIIPHPDQSGRKPCELRFILSLRATGEGHISSIVFRSGILDCDNRIAFDGVSDYVETPTLQLDSDYDCHLFELKLNEMGACNETTAWILDRLPEWFTYTALKDTLAQFHWEHPMLGAQQTEAIAVIDWLAHSNYETTFRPEYPISERVIFPVSRNESAGIEDARFVRFEEDSGEATYYATYTAYNGFSILPQLIETKDFVTFNIITLNGRAVQNKGMALFPRKVGGRYAMLSRQDGENNHIMFSEHLHFWQESEIIQEPSRPWEFLQIGNCGFVGIGAGRRFEINGVAEDGAEHNAGNIFRNVNAFIFVHFIQNGTGAANGLGIEKNGVVGGNVADFMMINNSYNLGIADIGGSLADVTVIYQSNLFAGSIFNLFGSSHSEFFQNNLAFRIEIIGTGLHAGNSVTAFSFEQVSE